MGLLTPRRNMEARLIQGCLLKNVVEAVKDLLNEATWKCSSTGMSLQAADSSRVCCLSILLRCDGFSRYSCYTDLTMGMKLDSMSKILKCARNDDIITLRAEEEYDLKFIFESPNGENVSYYTMKLDPDCDTNDLGPTETDSCCVIKMPAAKLQSICQDLSQVGQSVTIKCHEEGVQFSASGDIGEGFIKLDAGSSVTIEMQEACIQTYDLKYLTLFTKATPLSGNVTLSMSTEGPLVTEYKIGDLGYIRYHLAAKEEDEEDE